MRAMLLIAAAVTLGLAGGYGWSAMTAPVVETSVPPAATQKAIEAPKTADDTEWARRAKSFETADDRAWAARANEQSASAVGPARSRAVETSTYYSGCNEVRAAGKAPLYAGQPGYRSEMDGDGDGIACEPIRG